MLKICPAILPIFALWIPLRSQEVSYEFAGAELTRVVDGKRQKIGCTEPGGMGEVRSVARSPHGTVYVASKRGLFSLSDDVSHTTPLPLEDGAPSGEPRWVGVDRFGTIWLWTTEAFGCVDPVHLFGQIHRVNPERVDITADGTLELVTSAGESEYRPRSGPDPTLSIVHADEAPVGGVVHVRVTTTVQGSPIFGWRLGRRHRFRYQREPDFEIEGLEPGDHDLHFVVFDSDLRRSSQQTVRVSVPYPKTYSKSIAVPGILVAMGLLFGFLWLRARRAGGGRVRYTKAVLSAILTVVVGLQVLAGLFPHARGWPFVGFSMYSQKYLPGQHTYQALILGVDEKGARLKLDPAIAGFPSDGYWQALLPMVYGGDEPCRRFLEAYNKRLPPNKQLRGFVIHDHKHRLTSEGPVVVAPVVMRVYPEGLLRERN